MRFASRIVVPVIALWLLCFGYVVVYSLSRRYDAGLSVWAVGLSVVLLGIVAPMMFYGRKVTQARRKTLSDFIDQHEGQIACCSHAGKREGDVVVPVFCGFLFGGHRSYVLLERAQDGRKALLFIQRLRALCLTNNSWHFDFFTGRVYGWAC